MKQNHGTNPRNEREKQLLERLRRRPDLWARFEAILALTEVTDGALRTADQVEELLVEEVRRLGSETMQQWAAQAEERTASEFGAAHPRASVRKKGADLVVRFRSGHRRGADLARASVQLSATFHRAGASQRAGQMAALAAGADRLRGRAFLCRGWCAAAGALRLQPQCLGGAHRDAPARGAGWGLRSHIHVVADGAEWISLQSREVFGSQATVLTDFYHGSQYLPAAGPVCRPGAPRPWLHTQQKRLKRGALAPVRAARRDLENRRAALDYAGAIARQLPIGSGLIESGHKHVLHARLKGAGTAWLPANAAAIAQLRVLRANQHWDAFWAAQPIPAMHHNQTHPSPSRTLFHSLPRQAHLG